MKVLHVTYDSNQDTAQLDIHISCLKIMYANAVVLGIHLDFQVV